jgi:hypothetical protein
VEDVVGVLADRHAWKAAPPKVLWLLDRYDDLGRLVDYLLGVHRAWHVAGARPPTLALFLDEVWRAAPRAADANEPAVRVFTEGFQHGVVGVALSQWVGQVASLIPGNAYEYYIFDLWDKDAELLRSYYRMEIPDEAWLRGGRYRYWRYDGTWWRGDAEGREVAHDRDATTPVPPVSEGDEELGDDEAGLRERSLDRDIRGWDEAP